MTARSRQHEIRAEGWASIATALLLASLVLAGYYMVTGNDGAAGLFLLVGGGNAIAMQAARLSALAGADTYRKPSQDRHRGLIR